MPSDKEQKTTTEEFKKSFDKKLDSAILPARFAKDYHVTDCIKETPDRSVYIIADKDENKFILKTGKDKRAEALWQEFHLNEQLIKIPGLMIPEALDCIETDEGCFLMNSYIPGLNLVQYQEKYAPLSEPDVISLMFKMCHIIQILHSQDPPIIHRDVKPENFVLEKKTGVLYLVDLDTGRQFLPKKKRDTMFVGTFSQAAPEQFGFSQSDIRTDIYGLGKSMVYLLTGDASAENIGEYGISPDFQKIVSKSTEFDPEKRYADVKQMIQDLKRYQMRHITLRSYRPAVFCSILFLALGLSLGYAAGTSLSDNNRSMQPTNNINDTSTADNIANNATITDTAANETDTSAEPAATDTTDNSADATTNSNAVNSTGTETDSNTDSIKNNTDNTEADSGNPNNSNSLSELPSLRDQAGAFTFTPEQYKDYYDAIIMDYYANDDAALAKDCEALVSAIQKDKELNRVKEEDYSKQVIDNPNEFWDRDSLSNLRLRIAYKDQLIYRMLGHYDEYKNQLMATFGSNLSNPNGNGFLSCYARGERFGGTADDFTTYSYVLSDCIQSISDAIDKGDMHKNTSGN